MQSPKSYMNYGDSRNGDYKVWNNKRVDFDADVLATYHEEFGENFGISVNAGSSVYQRRMNNSYLATDGLIRSEEHTSELQSRENLVCRLLLEKKKKN